jgi:hypothetical protein
MRRNQQQKNPIEGKKRKVAFVIREHGTPLVRKGDYSAKCSAFHFSMSACPKWRNFSSR